MTDDGPKPMLCTYVPIPGKEVELGELLKRHGPALEKLGLQAPGRSPVWKATGKGGKVKFVERFDWVDSRAPEVAHQHPEVMAMWEPIGALCEEMDFSVVELIAGSE